MAVIMVKGRPIVEARHPLVLLKRRQQVAGVGQQARVAATDRA